MDTEQPTAIGNRTSAIGNRIHSLSASVVNKIAAGEVIERPASVVKELMENAIDAGATRVDVSVEGGGTLLVRVTDDGCGIAEDQLALAVACHATSKIEDADDLFRVGTLGFRGEALASIAEISRLHLRSRTADANCGAELEVTAGSCSPITPCGCPPGTSIEVRNLFFNTPVRRKFLKSDSTEMGHVSEAFTRIALAFPHVHFNLRHNNRELFDLPASEDWSVRIGRFFGQELAESLIYVESRDRDVGLRGFVAHPSQSRSHPRMQYLFLNGRHIRDRVLQHALGEAYRGLLLTGRYPISFLCFEMPPEIVDVNVHPTKLEVRFQDGGRLYSHLLSTLRMKFLGTDLNARLTPATDAAQAWNAPAGQAELRNELVGWAKAEVERLAQLAPASSGPGYVPRSWDAGPSITTEDRPPLELVGLGRNWTPAVAAEPDDDAAFLASSVDSLARWAADGSGEPTRAIQVHNRYLIAETPEGMVVIDQHALHERVLYEQLREKVLAGAVETQNLLVPEPVDLSPAEAAAALENSDLLAKLGLKVEPFGGDTVLVGSHPAMLSKITTVDVFRALVDQLMAGGKAPEKRDLLDELLHMFACKAAVKAGDRLSQEEIDALLAKRDLVQDSHHCPHGRPTALIFTREELDKQFKRT